MIDPILPPVLTDTDGSNGNNSVRNSDGTEETQKPKDIRWLSKKDQSDFDMPSLAIFDVCQDMASARFTVKA